jgi:hypothetical protein
MRKVLKIFTFDGRQHRRSRLVKTIPHRGGIQKIESRLNHAVAY